MRLFTIPASLGDASETSSFRSPAVPGMRDSSRANKDIYDQDRLDRYYQREWRINKILGREARAARRLPHLDSAVGCSAVSRG